MKNEYRFGMSNSKLQEWAQELREMISLGNEKARIESQEIMCFQGDDLISSNGTYAK